MKYAKIIFLILPLIGCSYPHSNAEQSTSKISEPIHSETDTNSLTVKQVNKQPWNNHEQSKKTVQSAKKQGANKIILDVPLVKQNPELKYGCEVTSLAMVLQYAGVSVNKMTLAKEIKKDRDPIVKDKSGNIISWGNPADGFVGDMTGRNSGYAVFDQPIADLMEKYLPERSVNLTGRPFDELLKYVENKRPVVVWTTGDYHLPDRWESWKHGQQTIKTPLDLHAVVLVGFDDNFVYINDPLWGKKAHKVNKQQFIDSWIALKKRAVSYN
jgi:uncharacterized protein YvpB